MADASDRAEIEAHLMLVNRRTAELIDDIKEYRRRVMVADPDIGGIEAFEGWTIQKIAGLQVAVETLAAEIRTLLENR